MVRGNAWHSKQARVVSEIPANMSSPEFVVSVTCRKQKDTANTGSTPVGATWRYQLLIDLRALHWDALG